MASERRHIPVGKQHIGVGNVCIWCDHLMPCREILLDENSRLQALLAERDAKIARLREALEPYTSHRLSLLTTETANHVRATVAIDLMDKRQAVASLEAMRAYICQTVPSMLEALRKARAAFAARGGAS